MIRYDDDDPNGHIAAYGAMEGGKFTWQSYVARTQAKDRGARAWARVRGKENDQGQWARPMGKGQGYGRWH